MDQENTQPQNLNQDDKTGLPPKAYQNANYANTNFNPNLNPELNPMMNQDNLMQAQKQNQINNQGTKNNNPQKYKNHELDCFSDINKSIQNKNTPQQQNQQNNETRGETGETRQEEGGEFSIFTETNNSNPFNQGDSAPPEQTNQHQNAQNMQNMQNDQSQQNSNINQAGEYKKGISSVLEVNSKIENENVAKLNATNNNSNNNNNLNDGQNNQNNQNVFVNNSSINPNDQNLNIPLGSSQFKGNENNNNNDVNNTNLSNNNMNVNSILVNQMNDSNNSKMVNQNMSNNNQIAMSNSSNASNPKNNSQNNKPMDMNNPMDNNQMNKNIQMANANSMNNNNNNNNNINMMNPLQNNNQMNISNSNPNINQNNNQMNKSNKNYNNNINNQNNIDQMSNIPMNQINNNNNNNNINQFQNMSNIPNMNSNNQNFNSNNLMPQTNNILLGNQNNNNINANNNMNQNININAQVDPKAPYTFSRYKHASRTTLKNLGENSGDKSGDTSYLNAVLQLLGTSRSLSNYFLNPNNTKFFVDNMNIAPFAFVLYRLFTHFYPYPEKSVPEVYEPETLFTILGTKNKIYESKSRRNPNDLILFILNYLHREINLIKTQYLSNDVYTDKQKAISEFLDNYNKSNKSIISLNFIWFQIKSQKCTQCQTDFYSLQSYETLDLDLSNFYKMNSNSPLTIGKCLEFQTFKNERFFCKICKIYNMSNITTRIYTLPNYLVFSLNRESANQNINLLNVPFIVEEYIELSNYIEYSQSFSRYELQAIVSISMKDNKYVCFGKSPVDHIWYLYNDENCCNGDIQTVLNLNNNNNQGFIPCILLYKAISKSK